MRTLAFAAVVAVAIASCPNLCSGHGWCDENDRCICFRAPGTANNNPAYVGADCSQRVCPYGVTHDLITDATQELSAIWSEDRGSKYVGFLPADGDYRRIGKLRAFLSGGFLLPRDYGVDIRVVTVNPTGAGASIKFQWKLSSQKTYNPEVTAFDTDDIYLSRSKALHLKVNNKDTGLYIYFDAPSASQWTEDNTLVAGQYAQSGILEGDRYWLNVTGNDGVQFLSSNANTAHQQAECSGRGVCERTSGTCTCVEGYTGDACQRTTCPSDCSGHGVCQSQSYFVADAVEGTALSALGVSYTNAFDANSNYGCKCDDGYRGADCAQRECPSGPDPMRGDGGAEGLDCSGRGICDYSTGLCRCYRGFFGERCEEQSTLV